MVEAGAGLPALTDLMVSCHGYLVDDDCGRAVGILEDVFADAEPSHPIRLLVVQGWAGSNSSHPPTRSSKVAPCARRPMFNCCDGHLLPGTDRQPPGSRSSPML